MKLDFSVGLGRNEPLNEIGEYSQICEQSGFSHVTWVDIPFLSPDVHVMMTLSALNTKTIKIGHGVIALSTYHPMVIANGAASINNISGGRAFIGLGPGADFGDVYRAATVNDMRTAVTFLRKFMSGEVADWKGAKMHSEWIGQPVPIYMAAEGPRMLELAGEVADGVISIGAQPEFVKWKMGVVAKGAEKANRDPSDIEFWVRTMIYPTDSKEEAKLELSPYPIAYGMVQNLLDSSNHRAYELPRILEKAYPGMVEELIADSKQVRSVWDPYGVERLDAPWVDKVTPRLIDFFHMRGKPDEICEQIYQLGELGVKNISPVMFTVIDKKSMIKEIGSSIIPHFRD